MKILFTDTTLLHGGAERVIALLSNELVRRGYEIEVLLYYDKPIWYNLDKNVKILNDEHFIGKAGVMRHIAFRRKYFKKSDADIIVSFLAPNNMINIISTFFTSKIIIVADRNDPRKTPVNNILRFVRNFLYRFADGIVLQSTNNKEYFSKNVQKKSEIIFNPVDVGEYNRSALLTEKKDEIVSVGRLINQKNPFMLMDAYKKILNQHPTYVLTYLGEGDLMDSLKKHAEDLGIAGRVNFLGAVKNVFEYIRFSKLYVMTSDYEGMPNALIEAMCIGVPVVSTKVSGAVDLIAEGVNGRLVNCSDVDELAITMHEMIDNYDKTKDYAVKAVSLNEQLDVVRITDCWLDFINRVKK